MKGLISKMLVAVLAISMVFGGALGASAKSNGKHNGHGKGNHGNKGNARVEVKMEFKDVDMEWARKHIASLAAKGIFEGYADGTFQPNKPVTRQEAIVTAIRLMGLSEEAESDAKKKSHLNLKDEKNIADWARGYIAVALENDLFFENEDKLQPNKPADRLWVTTMLVKALGLDAEAREKMNTKLSFKDAKSIPAGSVGYVAVAVEKGIVKGYSNNTFQPNKPVTRAEIAAFLDRAGEELPNDGALRGVLKTAVSNNILVLDNGQHYVVDPNAFVYKNNKKISINDLRAGDSIVFRTYNDVVIFIEVIGHQEDKDKEHKVVTGTLASKVKDGVVSIKTSSSKTDKYKLASNAVITRNGINVKAGDLQVGDMLTAHVANGFIVLLTANNQTAANDNFTGTVSAPVSNNVLSVYKDKQLIQYAIKADADIFRKDQKVSASALRAGDEVFVRVENYQVVLITVTKPAEESTSLNGTITMVATDNSVVVIKKDGTDTAYAVAADAKIYRGNVQVSLDKLKAGDVVYAKLQDHKITFLQVTELAEQREFTVTGLFHSMTLNSQGKIATISVTDTVYQQISIYNVSSDVKIVGDTEKLIQNYPVELKGRNQVVTQITIK